MIRWLFALSLLLASTPTLFAIDDYKLGPDSQEQPGVPKGKLESFTWKSQVFPDTIRECWIYVPAQYDPKTPANVMVFQDGASYKGGYRAPIVLDNLIHRKQVPVIIGIFIDPGSGSLTAGKGGSPDRKNRSFEYDTLSNQYVTFLEKEILPEVSKKYNLRQDAAGRAICGASSGGICAFTTAWERPDLFSKVLSHIGSFTNIRGGDRYPGMIRKTPSKPIRVFLQDGSNDLDNGAGNWFLGNLQMEAALKFKKYDLKTAWGDGKHSGNHGSSILPESLVWLWRAEGEKASARKIERLDPRFDKLFPASAEIETLASSFQWVEGPVWVKNGGYLLFSDIPNNIINKWQPGRGITPFLKPAGYTGGPWPRPGATGPKDEPGTNGLNLDPDGRLVMCCHGDRIVARLDEILGPKSAPAEGADQVQKQRTILASKYNGKRLNSPNDLVYHSSGDLYFTDPPYGLAKNIDDPARELDFQGVYRLKKDGTLQLLTKEMSRPNGLGFSPDEKTLYVANSDPTQAIWMAFPVEADGTLGKGRVLYDATPFVKAKKPGLPDGLKVDVQGNIFATGPGGVHVFAPDGTLLGTLDTGVPTANCAFGEDGSTLFIAANQDLCKIRTSTKGKGF